MELACFLRIWKIIHFMCICKYTDIKIVPFVAIYLPYSESDSLNMRYTHKRVAFVTSNIFPVYFYTENCRHGRLVLAVQYVLVLINALAKMLFHPKIYSEFTYLVNCISPLYKSVIFSNF